MTASSDTSSRFVLAEDAPYLKNMAALWTADPALAQAIEATQGQPSYRVEASRSGPPTVSVPTPDGRTLYLHSKYDPAAEAVKLNESIDAGRNVAFYVFGFGLGYHVEQLFDRASEESLFAIFEPDLLLLRTAFECRDLSEMIESRRLMFFTQLDKSDLLARLTPQSALISIGVEQVVHPPSQQLAGAFHDQMRLWIEEFASFSRTSINTVVLNSRKTAENIGRNIGWYAATPSMDRLTGRHRGEPAIIVSAGPSLRKNKHLLKELTGRAVFIAVQTTLQPLLEMGIEPQFVTSLDYHEICTRFFERLPDSLRTEMVAEPKANSAILSMYPGPLSLLGNSFAEGLLREMRLRKTELTSGATVAHLAYYLAEHLGCDPIIFVGQDLGFSDGLCYTPGTSYEDVWRPELSRFGTVEMKQWEQIVRERFILRRIPDQEGRPMYTEERLFTYLQQFERDFLRTKTQIIDATEGGAAKRGTTVMKLSEAAEEFCTDADRISHADDHPGLNWDRLAESVDCLKRRRGEAQEIERISRSTLPLLEEIRDHLDDQARVNRAISSIDVLRAKMNELGATYDLVTQLCQPVELKRFESDRKIAAAKAQATEKQRLQVMRDIENVRGVMEAAGLFQALMDEVIDRLSAMPEIQDKERGRVKNATAILSMLHEGPERNSATRLFRGEPVLRWTLKRLANARRVPSVAVLCWEDQLDCVAKEAGGSFVLAKGPRVALAEVDAISAARRWSDGWRGGLLSTCDFDLGFYAPWFRELALKVESDAVLLVDPASALVDPAVLDGLVAHAQSHPEIELCFVPAAPGLGGALFRAGLLERLAAAKTHGGRLLHYLPDQLSREPLSGEMCAPLPTPVARTTQRFKLDSDRQIARMSAAMVTLNGHLISSSADELVQRANSWETVDPLPREVVLELNTNRATRPIWWPGSYHSIQRPPMPLDMARLLFSEMSALDDTRLTIAGVGDPLLCEALFDIISAARTEGMLWVHVETDFLGASPETIARLAAAPVDVVSVHLPAMSPRTYEAVMGTPGYERVMEAIRDFAAARNGRSVPILVPTFTKCRQNMAEMEAWYDQWLRAVGCAVVRGPSDCGGQIPDVSVADMAPPRRKACSRLASRLMVLCDGRIVSCEEDVLGRQALGEVGRDSVQDVWQKRFADSRRSSRRAVGASIRCAEIAGNGIDRSG